MAEEEAHGSTVTMVDEEGKEHEFEVLEVVSIHGKEYALLCPQGTEGEDVLIMRVSGDTLEEIEDDHEFEHVIAHLEGHAAH